MRTARSRTGNSQSDPQTTTNIILPTDSNGQPQATEQADSQPTVVIPPIKLAALELLQEIAQRYVKNESLDISQFERKEGESDEQHLEQYNQQRKLSLETSEREFLKKRNEFLTLFSQTKSAGVADEFNPFPTKQLISDFASTLTGRLSSVISLWNTGRTLNDAEAENVVVDHQATLETELFRVYGDSLYQRTFTIRFGWSAAGMMFTDMTIVQGQPKDGDNQPQPTANGQRATSVSPVDHPKAETVRQALTLKGHPELLVGNWRAIGIALGFSKDASFSAKSVVEKAEALVKASKL